MLLALTLSNFRIYTHLESNLFLYNKKKKTSVRKEKEMSSLMAQRGPVGPLIWIPLYPFEFSFFLSRGNQQKQTLKLVINAVLDKKH